MYLGEVPGSEEDIPPGEAPAYRELPMSGATEYDDLIHRLMDSVGPYNQEAADVIRRLSRDAEALDALREIQEDADWAGWSVSDDFVLEPCFVGGTADPAEAIRFSTEILEALARIAEKRKGTVDEVSIRYEEEEAKPTGIRLEPMGAMIQKPTGHIGGHLYPGTVAESFFTSDCKYGCGCWMGQSSSGGPEGIDPFGSCPKAPDESESS